MSTKPIDPKRCITCRIPIGAWLGSIVYMSEERDPLQTMPLCPRCAILACFRCGKAGIK